MPDESVKFTISGDSSKAVAEQKKVIAQQEATIKKLQATGRESKKTGDAAGGMADKAMKGAGAIAVAVTGVGSAATVAFKALNLMGREIDNIRRRQAAAAGVQISFAEARAGAMLQRPADMTAADADRMIKRVADAAGLPQTTVWGAAGSMFSAKGAASTAQLESSMIAAGKVRRAAGPAVDMAQLGGAILDVGTAAGISGPAFGGQSLAWIRQFGGGSRITALGRQAGALAPVVRAGQAMGVGAERSAELLAALTHLGADPQGESSRTAAIHFMKQVMGGPFGQVGESFDERLGSLQRRYGGMSAAERNRFMQTFGGEARQRGAFQGLLGRQASALAALSATERAITSPTTPGLDATGAAYLDALKAHPAQGIKAFRDTIAKTVEDFQLADPGALTGQLRTDLPKLAMAVGASALSRKAMGWRFDLDTGARGRSEEDAFQGALLSDRDIARAISPWRTHGGPRGNAYSLDLPDDAQPAELGGWRRWQMGIGPDAEVMQASVGGRRLFYSANPDVNAVTVETLAQMLDELQAIRAHVTSMPNVPEGVTR